MCNNNVNKKSDFLFRNKFGYLLFCEASAIFIIIFIESKCIFSVWIPFDNFIWTKFPWKCRYCIKNTSSISISFKMNSEKKQPFRLKRSAQFILLLTFLFCLYSNVLYTTIQKLRLQWRKSIGWENPIVRGNLLFRSSNENKLQMIRALTEIYAIRFTSMASSNSLRLKLISISWGLPLRYPVPHIRTHFKTPRYMHVS